MRAIRIVLGLLLVAGGGLAATLMGYQMLLAAAYALWGPAFAYCMGTAIASMVLCLGGYVAVGRMPGFMVYTPPAPRGGLGEPPPVQAPRKG